MAIKKFQFALDQFMTFGDLLRYLRRRAGMTQRELAIAVGYSHAQISRLEQNQRAPDMAMIAAQFVPALDLEDEPQVATRLVELAGFVLRQGNFVSEEEDAPTSGTAPFKGLHFFEEEDADLFYGREDLTGQLVEWLRRLTALEDGPRLLAVVGASGSGKSSLVRAGLLPALRHSAPFSRWGIRCITPSAHPFERVGDDLLHPVTPLLLVIDQFEELFTLCEEEDERQAFVGWLMNAAGGQSGHVIAIITLRADFYGRCAPYPALREALAARQIYIGPMSAANLRRAIEEPARRGEWELEPSLVDLLLKDLGADQGRDPEPGSLPLLSHALLETWRRRSKRTMTISGYLASGGIRGAIAETADEVFYDQLVANQRNIARTIFLRLIQIGEGEGGTETRRRAAPAEFIHSSEDEVAVHDVLRRLADARLVTTGEDSVELSHEALIRGWPTLRTWLEADREGLLLHRNLTLAAESWQRQKRDPSELYRGGRLAQASAWAAEHGADLSKGEQIFLSASEDQARQEESEREAQRSRELIIARSLAETERRSAAQLRKRAVFLTVAVVLALLMAGAALFLGETARKSAVSAQTQGRIAYSRELAAAALNTLEIDPERSILLAVQAVSTTRQVDGTVLPEAEEALHRSLLASRVRLTLSGHNQNVVSCVYSPDGKRLATIGRDGTAIVWDTASGKELLRLPGTTIPWDDFGYQMIDFSRDGSRIVTADRNLVKVWDANSGQLLRTLDGHTKDARAVAFSPDGKRIASGSLDDTVYLWNVETGEVVFSFPGNPETVQTLAYRPDGAEVAIGTGHTVKIFDVLQGKLVTQKEFTDPIESVAYRPDGARLVVGTGNGLQVWDAELAGEQPELAIQENLTSVTFSPDGAMLAASSGSLAKVFDAQTGREIQTLSGHTGWVIDVAFSPDGNSLATTGFDQSARIWSLVPGRETVGISGSGLRVAVSPDGKQILTDAAGGSAKLWDAETGRELLTFTGHQGPVTGVVFSPDGKRVAAASFDTTAKVWDIASGELLLTLTGHEVGVRDVAFSADGERIATAGFDQTARVWDAQTGRELLKLSGHNGIVIGVAFSPDGTRLATSSSDKTANIWDLHTGEVIFTLSGHTDVIPDIAYSPDGSKVATGSQDGAAKVWDAHTGTALFTLTGHSSEIQSVAFNRDGSMIATGSGDNTAILWDVVTGQELHTLPGSEGGVSGVVFDPSNPDRVIIASTDGVVRAFILNIDDLLSLAQARVTRPLTTWECQKYLHLSQCPVGK